MKRITLLLLASASIVAAGPAVAAPHGPLPHVPYHDLTTDEYTVQPGDNLWTLSDVHLHDPMRWRKLLDYNPFLADRISERNGRTYVMIRPYEKLYGLYELGLVPSTAPRSGEPRIILPPEARKPMTVVPDARSDEGADWTPLLWLAALAAFVAAVWYGTRRQRQELEKDPVTSGRPIVSAGVQDARHAHDRFQEIGTRQFRQRFTILETVRGRGWGTFLVRYADGRRPRRKLDGHDVWRARVRLDNGTETELYMLQGCGNDLIYGGVDRYSPDSDFRFEPYEEEAAPEAVVPAAEASPAPEPAAPPLEAEPASESEELPEGAMQVQFEPSTGDKPTMLRISGVDLRNGFTFQTGPEGTTFRYTAPTKRRR